ncbi:MAG: hypothetical protein NUV77_11515, partial [Thermoguttaceae bacterium]|nr:hypothetical protein [Thermoguttaceae bacterium]
MIDSAVDAAGNLYLAGYFSGTVDFDPGEGEATLTGASGDMFLAQYRADGSFGWVRHVLSAQTDPGQGTSPRGAVALDAQGNIYVTGDFLRGTAEVAGTPLANLDGGSDVFIVKFAAEGDPTWAAGPEAPDWVDHFPCTWYTDPHAIAPDNAGNVYVAGMFQESIQVGKTTYYELGIGEDAWVAKLDAQTGAVNWFWQTGGPGDARLWDIVANADALFIAGRSRHGGDMGVAFGDIMLDISGGWVARLTPQADVLWVKATGGIAGNVFAGSVDNLAQGQGPNGEAYLYAAGRYEGTIDLGGGYRFTSAGSIDTFAAKMDPDTGNFLWAGSVGGPYGDGDESYPPVVAADASGGLYLSSYYQNLADLDPGPGGALLVTQETSSVTFEGYVAKFDPNPQSDGYQLGRLWNFDTFQDSHSASLQLAVATVNGTTAIYAAGLFVNTMELPAGILESKDEQGNYVAQPFVTKITPGPLSSDPVAVDDGPYSSWMNYPLVVPKFEGVLLNDANPGISLHAYLVTGASHGQVSINDDGSFRY